MTDKTYNGWTNYETWRVNLEMIDESDWHYRIDDVGGEMPEAYELGQSIKQWAEDFIEESSPEGLARDYALAFLQAVNWREIAAHMIENYSEEA